MIINKSNKSYQTRSDKPNENWEDDINYFVVDDSSVSASKIKNNFPYYDFVLDEDGELIDITPTERPPVPPVPPSPEERLSAIEDLLITLI